jgi:hypothetical protein
MDQTATTRQRENAKKLDTVGNDVLYAVSAEAKL